MIEDINQSIYIYIFEIFTNRQKKTSYIKGGKRTNMTIYLNSFEFSNMFSPFLIRCFFLISPFLDSDEKKPAAASKLSNNNNSPAINGLSQEHKL